MDNVDFAVGTIASDGGLLLWKPLRDKGSSPLAMSIPL